MPTAKPSYGDIVTVKTPVEAYYSGMNNTPVCFFDPADQGTVRAIDVPNVTGQERTYSCVDFWKIGTPYNDDKSPWRVVVYSDNIVIVERAKQIVYSEDLKLYAEGVYRTYGSDGRLGDISKYVIDLLHQHCPPVTILIKLQKLHGIAVRSNCPKLDSDIMQFSRFIRGLDTEQDLGSRGGLNGPSQGFKMLKENI